MTENPAIIAALKAAEPPLGDVAGLVNEARLDAKAFREHVVYDSEGDPIRLTQNAARLDQYADAITALARQLAERDDENKRLRDMLNTHTPPATQADVPIDSGFTPENIADAEWLWTNLPVFPRKFHEMQTHERALVCHTVDRFRRDSLARHRLTARRKALEDAAELVESGMFNSRGQAQPALAAKLRAMIEGEPSNETT